MSILYTDSGAGPDANPIGGNYTTVPGLGGYSAIQRLTNQFAGTGTGDCAAYVNTFTPPADGYCEIIITAVGGGADDGGPMYRLNTTTGDCYMTDFDGTNVGTFWFNGANHTLIAGTVIAGALGNKFRTQCKGTTISSLVQGVVKTSATDTNISAAGAGAIFGHASGFTATNLEIGDLTGPPPARVPRARPSPTGPRTQPWFASHVFQQNIGPASTVGVITELVGKYTWAGVPANLLKIVMATPGAYTWKGTTSSLSKEIVSTPGAWTWKGTASPLSTSIASTTGKWTWTGTGNKIAASIASRPGAYTWAGTHSPLSVQVTAKVGAYTWAGVASTFGGPTTLNATPGAWRWGSGGTSTIPIPGATSAPMYQHWRHHRR